VLAVLGRDRVYRAGDAALGCLGRQRRDPDHQRRYVKADLTQLSSALRRVLTVAVNDSSASRRRSPDSDRSADYEAQVRQPRPASSARRPPDNLANQIELQYATIAQAEAQQASALAKTSKPSGAGAAKTLTQTEAGTRQSLNRPPQPMPAPRPIAGEPGLIAAQPISSKLSAPGKAACGDCRAPSGAGRGQAQARLTKITPRRRRRRASGSPAWRLRQHRSNLIAVVRCHVYVIANYKETAAHARQAGQPVDVVVDTFSKRNCVAASRA